MVENHCSKSLSYLHASQSLFRDLVLANMAMRFHRGRTLYCLSGQTVMPPPTDSCHLLLMCQALCCVSLCMLSLRFYYIFLYIILTFCTLLYFTVFNFNYEMGLIITISQRGKGSVIEDRWYGQNHTTSKWGETADDNIDHMLDQEQRREKPEKKFVY